jgi:CDP-diglyceride synthetase
MKTTRLLIAILAAIAITGAIDAYLKAAGLPEPFWYTLGSTFLIGLLIFVWYYIDSESRAYQRSRWMNIAVVGVAVLAIPIYVMKSHDKGKRGRALVNVAGFALLCVLADVLGGFVGGFIA